MKYAVCDNCGFRDDWQINGIPILTDGAVIQIRSSNGSDDFESTLEICAECKTKLFKAFPKLLEVVEKSA